jgi:hypothetical protein
MNDFFYKVVKVNGITFQRNHHHAGFCAGFVPLA